MTSSAPAARGDAASHTHTNTFSAAELDPSTATGYSKRVLDSSYEATVIGGARVSIGPAITILKNAIGRKVSGADLQVLRALIVALIMLEGERFRTVIPSLTFTARREGLGFHHRACDWYPHEERDCFYRAFMICVRSTRCTFGWDSTSAHVKSLCSEHVDATIGQLRTVKPSHWCLMSVN